ncbi:MAG: 50S ribosomal protein L18 [Candidatus Omnitrophota bacterium]|nr:MAG: 50S ribosomal protein L18 [Candidatus Omnitrophota bacterium]
MFRARRTRAKIKKGGRARLSVFRSNRNIHAQIIDDRSGTTVASAWSGELPSKDGKAESKNEKARKVGELVAERAEKAGVREVVFDRGKYKYHGRVRAVAEGARKKGLKF